MGGLTPADLASLAAAEDREGYYDITTLLGMKVSTMLDLL